MKRNYYAIIPANVRYDKSLKPNAKLLFGEISALCDEKGYCWASNKYFADLYETTPQTVSAWVSSLENGGYITREIEYKPGTKQIIKRILKIVTPITKNHNTLSSEILPPINENLKDNSTIDTTFIKDDDVTDILQHYQKVKKENFVDLMMTTERERKTISVLITKHTKHKVIAAIDKAVQSPFMKEWPTVYFNNIFKEENIIKLLRGEFDKKLTEKNTKNATNNFATNR